MQRNAILKNQDNNLCGLYIVDKPLKCSSTDVVRVVKRAANKAKTGHAGTLDPMATGVVICCISRQATRTVPLLMDLTKVYETTIDLSAFSSTDDREGDLQTIDIDTPPTADAINNALAKLTGEIQQTPPAHSAIWVNGQRAYKLARRGQHFEIPSRIVLIDSIKLISYDYPNLEIVVTCGKGTYIRSLARQIGQLLNTGGYLASLRRTAIGPYTIDNAIPLKDIPETLSQKHLLPIPLRTKT